MGIYFECRLVCLRGAVQASVPADIRLQIVSPCIRPPDGEGWLHEIKHDGHRLVAIVPSRGQLKLLSRNGHDRTPLFRVPFRKLALSGRPLVLDGEIAVPDERGVTHIDLLQAASGRYGADRLTYFAFDLLHLDGHDPRRCPIEARKALLRRLTTSSVAVRSCLNVSGKSAPKGSFRNGSGACTAVESRVTGSKPNAMSSASS
ncbi:MAG: hypothetical protein E6G79_08760 [Alphaproteobacteria bacterium]|nr:MAG: hypothetical protein E6G79_08760 [Alphaproteobacteria bacterium]